MLTTESCYQALRTHDARFDGVFFVGVLTTGIYCRTVCPARTPRQENCRFFPSAAAAERAGFRPCLRCRPELAPGCARVDAVDHLATALLARLEDALTQDLRPAELARELGVSERHLRRVTAREYGVSPVELAQTLRLLHAKRLLTDTNLPVTEVAFASGFTSVRRFNSLFRERYRMTPLELRHRRARPAGPVLRCELTYHPPLDWEALLRFLAARALLGVEAVRGRRYLRSVQLGEHRGWMSAEADPERPVIRVELSASLAPVLRPTLVRVKRLFDLYADPAPIVSHLGDLAAARPGLRVPGAFDGWQVGLRAILGQQVSVRAATTLAGRFVERFSECIATPHPELTHLAPSAERIAGVEIEELIACGLPAARAHSIRTLARSIARDEVRLEPQRHPEAMIERLLQLPGIGDWTAQYLAMRALAWPDAFPGGDLALRRALGNPGTRAAREAAERWRPWRSYAAMHLWHSLETQV